MQPHQEVVSLLFPFLLFSVVNCHCEESVQYFNRFEVNATITALYHSKPLTHATERDALANVEALVEPCDSYVFPTESGLVPLRRFKIKSGSNPVTYFDIKESKLCNLGKLTYCGEENYIKDLGICRLAWCGKSYIFLSFYTGFVYILSLCEFLY